MKLAPTNITDTELALLRLLWDWGPSTVRRLTDELYAEGSHSQYMSVQSLLNRLEEKGCAKRHKDGRLNVFTATVSRKTLVAKRVREVADDLCDGSLAPLLSHLVEGVDLEQGEIDALRALIDRLQPEANDGTPS